jgi:tripartite ATP-independent transporter DctM subunit
MHWKRRAPGPEAWTSFKQLLRWCAAFFAASLLFTTTLFTLAFLVPAAQPWLAGHARALALPGFLFAFVAAAFGTSGEARAALKGAFWELILPFLVGGVVLAGGLTMAYEAAAFAALYVLVIEVFVYRDIQLRRDIPNVVKKSAILFGVIVALLATGTGFTAFLVQAEVPGTVVTWIDGLVTSPGAFLLLLDVFLVIVGMIVDPFTAIIVLVPLIGPIGRHYGIDECHLGIVVVLSLEIGALMPPLGLNTLISALRFERPLAKVYWALAPFLALLLIALMLVTYVPGLSTALASLVPAPPIRPPDEAPAEPIPPPPDDIFGEDDFDFEEQP